LRRLSARTPGRARRRPRRRAAGWRARRGCAAAGGADERALSSAWISLTDTTAVSTVGTASASESVSSSSGSACSRVSPSLASTPSAISNATTVMLSWPPPRFAALTSARSAPSMSSRCRSTTSRIESSGTMSVSPSEQSRKRSPVSAWTLNVSTSTSGSVPSARVMTERCGCVSASSRDSFPVLSSSLTSEWSSVSCSIRVLRMR
jgi:hypothetical protein